MRSWLSVLGKCPYSHCDGCSCSCITANIPLSPSHQVGTQLVRSGFDDHNGLLTGVQWYVLVCVGVWGWAFLLKSNEHLVP